MDELRRDPLDPEEVCRKYEELWVAGKAPEIEVFLGNYPASNHEELRVALQKFLFVAKTLSPRQGSLPNKGSRQGSEPTDYGLPPGATIGPYQVLKTLGEGGMGAVLLVQQTRPVQRLAALKLIKKGMDSRRVLRRFEGERQALARMSHTHIAQIFDAGTSEDGRPYFVMEYVDGLRIDSYVQDRALGLKDRIRLFCQVCEGVQHAHQKGILHRDLKPTNILVVEEDGKPLAKIIDFGLARAIDPSEETNSLMTLQGQVLGTPEYMAPEQAAGTHADLDSRTDLYALGAILYELLTESLPLPSQSLRSCSLYEMQRRIREWDPERPSLRANKRGLPWATKLKGDLDAICLKALAKDKEARYSTVAGLAQDLQAHLAHDPIQARPPSALNRVLKFTKKHRSASIAIVTVFLSLLVSFILALRAYQETNKALQETRTAQKQAKDNFDFLQSYLQSLSDRFKIRTGGNPLAQQRMTGFREDFEHFPLGPFPPAHSLWAHMADNQRARIVSLENPDGTKNKALEIQGIQAQNDATMLCYPLDPISIRYHPDFWVQFKVRVDDVPHQNPQERGTRLGLALNQTPDWRTGRSVGLFNIDKYFQPWIQTYPPSSSSPIPPMTWNLIRLHYQLQADGKVKIWVWINNLPIPVDGSPLARYQAYPHETQCSLLSISSGESKTWIDDLQVFFPTSARPYIRNLRNGHDYMLTPRPMTWTEAQAFASSRGGSLVCIQDELEEDWLVANFGPESYWIGLQQKEGNSKPEWVHGKGKYRNLDPHSPLPSPPLFFRTVPFQKKDNGSWKYRWKPGHGKAFGILEFEHPPLAASALRLGPGVTKNQYSSPLLHADSPPVLGDRFLLTLIPHEGNGQRLPSSTRPFLVLGLQKAAPGGRPLDLGPLGLPHCLLYPLPQWILPFKKNKGRFSLALPMPSSLSFLGQRFFLQAFQPNPKGPGPSLLPSNALVAQLGFDPSPGSLLWAQALGGKELSVAPPDEYTPTEDPGREAPHPTELAALPNGNVLLAARFKDMLAFGKKFPTLEDQTIVRGKGFQGVLACMDPTGKLLWAKTLPDPGPGAGYRLQVLPNGDFYLAGTYMGQAQLKASPPSKQAPPLPAPPSGERHIFVAHFRNNGTLLQTFYLGGPIQNPRPSFGLRKDGGFYLGTYFSKPFHLAEDQRKARLSKTFHPSCRIESLLASFDPRGKLLWVKSFRSNKNLRLHDCVTHPNGNISICGDFEGTATFGPHTTRTSKGSQDAFLATIEPSGKLSWLRLVQGKNSQTAKTITRDPHGNLYIGGTLKWKTTFPPNKLEIESVGCLDGFAAGYSPSGLPKWSWILHGTYGNERIQDISFSPSGQILVAGTYKNFTWASLDPISIFLLQAVGNEDIHLTAIDPNLGKTLWTKNIGGPRRDGAPSLTITNQSTPFLAGRITPPGILGSGEAHQTAILLTGLFVSRYFLGGKK